MSPAFEALFWGFISGGALVLGAAVGFLVNVSSRVVAGIMAFGSGVLISALSFELMGEAFEEAGIEADPGAVERFTALAEAAVYLATAPKSNSIFLPESSA